MLLEAHSRKDAAELRRIVANRERRSLDALLPDYRARLARALARPAMAGSNATTLLRAMESLAKPPAAEKARFRAALEKYRAGKLPLSAPRRILRDWIAKNPDDKFLARQTFFEPYPKELDSPARCPKNLSAPAGRKIPPRPR